MSRPRQYADAAAKQRAYRRRVALRNVSEDALRNDAPARLEPNSIYHLDALALLRALPTGSVDTVVTSPPYNLANTTGGGLAGQKNIGFWKNAALKNGYIGHDDDMPHEQYVVWQRSVLTECMRVLRDDGAIFYNHKWRVQDGLLQDRADIVAGFPVRQIIIWQRAGGINFNDGYFLPTYEVIYLIAKPDFRLVDGASGLGDVWFIPQETNTPHPAPFPYELPRRILSSVKRGLVVDPFVGSGTTCLAARNLGHTFIACDKSAVYVALAQDRLRLPFEAKAVKIESDVSDLPLFALKPEEKTA